MCFIIIFPILYTVFQIHPQGPTPKPHVSGPADATCPHQAPVTVPFSSPERFLPSSGLLLRLSMEFYSSLLPWPTSDLCIL